MAIKCVYIGILLLLTAIIYIKERNIAAPLFIFDVVWVFVFFCAATNDLVTPAKESTYSLFFGGVISLNLGGLISDCVRSQKYRVGRRVINIANGNYSFREPLTYFILFICLLFYLLNFVVAVRNVDNFSFSNIMSVANSENSLTRQYRVVNFLYTMVINPFSYIIPFFVAADYWVGQRDKKKLLLSVLVLLLRMLSSGNRLSFLFIFVFMIVVGILVKKINTSKLKTLFTRREKRKARFLIVALIVVAVVVFVYSTLSRGYDVKSNVFVNFAIPLRLFEIWAEKISESGEFGGGCASFQGVIYPAFYLIKNLLGLPMPSHIASVFDITTRTVTEWVFGGTYMHNAYVSIFWYFFYDLRIAGVILFSFFTGFLSQRAYRAAVVHPNIMSVSIYCAFTRLLIGSYSEMSFSTVGFGVGLIFLMFVIFKKSKMVERINKCEK